MRYALALALLATLSACDDGPGPLAEPPVGGVYFGIIENVDDGSEYRFEVDGERLTVSSLAFGGDGYPGTYDHPAVTFDVPPVGDSLAVFTGVATATGDAIIGELDLGTGTPYPARFDRLRR